MPKNIHLCFVSCKIYNQPESSVAYAAPSSVNVPCSKQAHLTIIIIITFLLVIFIVIIINVRLLSQLSTPVSH